MKEKVAIIGSGPAGVYCSYLIPNAHLFERSGAVGMDASSFSIGDSRIDVPLRSFHPDYYPCLNQLYLHASIPTVVTNHSIGFSVNNVPYLTYQTVRILGYDIILPNQHLSPFLLSKIMADSVIFFYNCKYLQDERLLHTITCGIGEYMTSNGYCNELITNIIVPFVCTIATCSTEAGYSYPASYVLDFFARASHFESPRRVSCGVNEMCKILCRKANLHLNANVTAVYKDFTIPKGNPNVCVEYDGKKAYFDHVIIATQANQACRMLSASSNEELKKVLSLFRYERTKVVTHTDQSFLPADKSLWRSVNIGTKGNECLASVLMNNMVNIETEKPVLQTSNHCVDPNPSLVLASTLFERAVCNLQTPKAIEQLESLQGVNGIFVIGSFAYPGIPLLEGAVCSAMKVSHRLGYTCPWYFLDPSNTFRGKLSETYYLSAKKSKVSRLHTLHKIFNKTLLELTLYQFTVWALIFILFLWNQLPLRRLEKWSTWNKIT